MKFKSIKTAQGLGKNAIEQLTAEFKKNKTSPNKLTSKSRVLKDTLTGLRYCPIPSSDPVVKLFKALEIRFGHYNNGGDFVDELILDRERDYRFDFAILSSMQLIEFDGFGYHRDLESFNRDRKKQRYANRLGWVVHRVTNRDIKEIELVISDIEETSKHRDDFSVSLSVKGRSYFLVESCVKKSSGGG